MMKLFKNVIIDIIFILIHQHLGHTKSLLGSVSDSRVIDSPSLPYTISGLIELTFDVCDVIKTNQWVTGKVVQEQYEISSVFNSVAEIAKNDEDTKKS